MGQMRLCFQLFVLGYLICTCGSTTLDSDNVLDGKWVLKDRSSATLLCTISPFTGALIWRFNYIKVAECTLKYCRQFSTGDGAFMFGFDTENGFFEFTINPVDMKNHNGKIIQCYDGTDTFNVTATVTESKVIQTGTGNTSSSDPMIVICACASILAAAGVVLLVIRKFVWKKCLQLINACQRNKPQYNNISGADKTGAHIDKNAKLEKAPTNVDASPVFNDKNPPKPLGSKDDVNPEC